ncbi:sodium- and chloride-dependent glycine transporter 2-like [Haliotis rufescens]|uniref:sodium- and chloride-dependent glycine transporter 2-like n=1 Tax=Haliotis rufescens TaxID=6454 RepID=UPI00201FB0E5|nr:sodium- and chloride-dependent glycine transporter 2-like [Haliotis rufescens]
MWIYGSRRFSDDVELMLGRRVPMFFNMLLGYVTPLLLTIALFLVLWQFKPPTYGDYQYPWVCRIAGWILASLPVIPVPVIAAVTVYKAKGSFIERLKASCTPDSSWKPSLNKYKELYRKQNGDMTGDC